MLTDVIGGLDKNGELIPELNTARIEALRADGTISGGMIPKLETCMRAVSEGVAAAVILDGRVPHSMLLELFTGAGLGPPLSRCRRAGPRSCWPRPPQKSTCHSTSSCHNGKSPPSHAVRTLLGA